MLNINATITICKSQLKQKEKMLWAVFDPAAGRFGHKCGPFWTRTVGRFGPRAVLVISLACISSKQELLHFRYFYRSL